MNLRPCLLIVPILRSSFPPCLWISVHIHGPWIPIIRPFRSTMYVFIDNCSVNAIITSLIIMYTRGMDTLQSTSRTADARYTPIYDNSRDWLESGRGDEARGISCAFCKAVVYFQIALHNHEGLDQRLKETEEHTSLLFLFDARQRRHVTVKMTPNNNPIAPHPSPSPSPRLLFPPASPSPPLRLSLLDPISGSHDDFIFLFDIQHPYTIDETVILQSWFR